MRRQRHHCVFSISCALSIFVTFTWNNFFFSFIQEELLKTGTEKCLQRPDYGSRKLMHLSWATFSDKNLNEIFVFISAYYDNRTAIPGRPAVAIITYALEFVPKPSLTCSFVYSNGSRSCLSGRNVVQEIMNCYFDPLDEHKPKPKKRIAQLLLCPVEGDDVPVAVQLSSTIDCQRENMSGLILVENYQNENQRPRKNIGVCLQGSLRQKGIPDLKHTLDNFINMCMFMGAEFVTLYASPDEVHKNITEHLLTNYSHVVNVIEWKVFKSHDYHGQNGVMHDCIYRHMYEANYLVVMDLDEMIIPFRHMNWPDMLNELEKKTISSYAGFSFMNKYYLESSSFEYEDLHKCKKAGVVSPYLTHVDESQCKFNHGDRSKYIVIPKLVVHAAVHSLCRVLTKDQLFPVDSRFAVSAHYRYAVDKARCKNNKFLRKYWHLKYFIRNYAACFCKEQLL